MDTDREKQIDLGPEYPFEALPAGECIISSSYQQEESGGYQIGSTFI